MYIIRHWEDMEPAIYGRFGARVEGGLKLARVGDRDKYGCAKVRVGGGFFTHVGERCFANMISRTGEEGIIVG